MGVFLCMQASCSHMTFACKNRGSNSRVQPGMVVFENGRLRRPGRFLQFMHILQFLRNCKMCMNCKESRTEAKPLPGRDYCSHGPKNVSKTTIERSYPRAGCEYYHYLACRRSSSPSAVRLWGDQLAHSHC